VLHVYILSPHARPDPVAAIVFALNLQRCILAYVFDEKNHYAIE